MGSLPDLTERTRSELRPAARTYSDPHKNKIQIRPSIASVKWNKTKKSGKHNQGGGGVPYATRRKDSCSSSLGAASVRRLLNRAPPRPSKTAFRSFAMLCATQLFSSAAMMSFTVIQGTENSSYLLALMHLIGAIVAPFSHIILMKVSIWKVVSITYALLTILFIALTVNISVPFLIPIFVVAGVGLGPLSAANATAATFAANSLAIGARDEEVRRRVLLRRLLRALRAAQDLGLLLGSLLLGIGITNWPSEIRHLAWNNTSVNLSKYIHQWPPPQYIIPEDTSEEDICGANGCPGSLIEHGMALDVESRLIFFIVWTVLVFIALLLSLLGVRGLPPSPPADNLPSLPFHKEPRSYLAAPMGFFIGLQNGFIFTSYVKWYAICVGGWEAAWTSLAGVATLQALAAATLSMAAARGMRGALEAGGAAAHACLVLALLRWRAARSDVALPAVAAAAWGACGGLWDVLQTSAGVGAAGWRPSWSIIWSARHAGMAVACAACGIICVRIQLAALAVSLILAVPLHAILEFKLRKANEQRIATNVATN